MEHTTSSLTSEILHRHWPDDTLTSPEATESAATMLGEVAEYLYRSTEKRGARTALPDLPSAYSLVGGVAKAKNPAVDMDKQLKQAVNALAEAQGRLQKVHQLLGRLRTSSVPDDEDETEDDVERD